LYQDKDLEIDPDYTTRLVAISGGFSSDVRENIVSHPVVVKNRVEPGQSTHISSESRQVMRKGFDLGISSPGLRMLYDVRSVLLTCCCLLTYLTVRLSACLLIYVCS